jgi:hypothetical protein
MRLFLNYITRRLLVSALCSATQTALVGPGQAEMLFRHRPTHAHHQVVGGSPLGDTLAMAEEAHPTSLASLHQPLPSFDAFAGATTLQ